MMDVHSPNSPIDHPKMNSPAESQQAMHQRWRQYSPRKSADTVSSYSFAFPDVMSADSKRLHPSRRTYTETLPSSASMSRSSSSQEFHKEAHKRQRPNRPVDEYLYDDRAVAHIFSMLDFHSLLSAAATCKRWRACLGSPLLESHWQTLYVQQYGYCRPCYDLNPDDYGFHHFNVLGEPFEWPLSCGQTLYRTSDGRDGLHISSKSLAESVQHLHAIESLQNAALVEHHRHGKHACSWHTLFMDETLLRHCHSLLRPFEFRFIHKSLQSYAPAGVCLEPFLLITDPSDRVSGSHTNIDDFSSIRSIVREKIFLGSNAREADWLDPLSDLSRDYASIHRWPDSFPHLDMPAKYRLRQACAKLKDFLDQQLVTPLYVFDSPTMKLVLLVGRLRSGNLLMFRYLYLWK